MVRVIVFSYKRRLQLDATIGSFRRHAVGDYEITVLDRKCPDKRFRQDFLDGINGSDYLLLCVDDAIFVDGFDLNSITDLLDVKTNAIGFLLNIGRNTEFCYMKNRRQAVPDFNCETDGFLGYRWKGAHLDFGYPLAVSSGIYRTKDIDTLIAGRFFNSPGKLEVILHHNKYSIKKSMLFCYEQSKVFCLPLTKVQTDFPNNRSGDQYTPEQLEKMYDEGKRIDIDAYDGFIPGAIHQEVDLHLRRG